MLVTFKLAPGSQMRHDRWQAMVSQESVDLLPACFVLKGLGPENEDLNVKLFVEGRKSPHTDKSEQLTTTLKVTESTPLSQRPAPSTLMAPSPAKTTPVQTSSILQLDHLASHPPTKSPLQFPTPPPTPPPPSTPLHSTVTETSSHTDNTAGRAVGDTPTGRNDHAGGHPRPSPSPNELKPPQTEKTMQLKCSFTIAYS